MCRCRVVQPLLIFVMMHSVSIAVRPFALQHFGKPLALGVGMVPEVEEEQQKHCAIEGDNVHKDGKLVAAVLQEEILTNVASD